MVARGGREALEQLLTLSTERGDTAVDPMISDIEMPRPDGYALTRAIREAPVLPRLKAIAHSSCSGGFNDALVREVKASCVVAKFHRMWSRKLCLTCWQWTRCLHWRREVG